MFEIYKNARKNDNKQQRSCFSEQWRLSGGDKLLRTTIMLDSRGDFWLWVVKWSCSDMTSSFKSREVDKFGICYVQNYKNRSGLKMWHYLWTIPFRVKKLWKIDSEVFPPTQKNSQTRQQNSFFYFLLCCLGHAKLISAWFSLGHKHSCNRTTRLLFNFLKISGISVAE